jgi:DNA gyrase inhibitor GyrI
VNRSDVENACLQRGRVAVSRNGDIDDALRDAIVEFIRQWLPHEPRRTGFAEAVAAGKAAREGIRAALKAAYRELAMRHHPDRGGSHQAMIGINALYERFEEILGRPG